MRYYKSTTQYHSGIDLHSRQIYVCVIDSQGNKLLQRVSAMQMAQGKTPESKFSNHGLLGILSSWR